MIDVTNEKTAYSTYGSAMILAMTSPSASPKIIHPIIFTNVIPPNIMGQAYFTFAKEIFYIEDISLIPLGTNYIKKYLVYRQGIFWWGKVDLNHRKHC